MWTRLSYLLGILPGVHKLSSLRTSLAYIPVQQHFLYAVWLMPWMAGQE